MAGSRIASPATMRFLVHGGVPHRPAAAASSLGKKPAERNAKLRTAGPGCAGRERRSLWLVGDLPEPRSLLLLLIVNEGGDFGGGHRKRIAAAAGKLGRERGVADHFAQVLARLAHDRFGGAEGSHEALA